jgi:DNA-binding IclR family transcriptional regulator
MPTVGARVPVHASASGRLYLAFDEARVGLTGDGGWERFTPSTPASLRALRKQVTRARSRGYDTNVAEWMPDVAVVAAPVHASDGLLGTVALATSRGHFARAGEAQLASVVQGAAQQISEQLRLTHPLERDGRATHE